MRLLLAVLLVFGFGFGVRYALLRAGAKPLWAWAGGGLLTLVLLTGFAFKLIEALSHP